MTTLHTVSFQRTVLATMVGLCISQSIFALENLEQLDDSALSQTTGEGIALLPENFSMRLNGADTAAGGAGTAGAGYINLIPVGPLSAAATAKGYQKADVWLYGLSLGQSKKNYGADLAASDWGVPFGEIGAGATDFARPITSWGTVDNPWVFQTLTDTNVPNFVGDTTKPVTYLTLEAPLYKTSAIAATDADYNLKLGLWADLYQRDSTVVASGYNGLSNRLRLAFAWDTFSVNGSNLKVFQTLDGVTPAMGGTYNATLKINGVPTLKTFNYGMNTSYNQTMGIAGLVRLNSRPTDAVRGTVSEQTNTRQIIQMNYTNTYAAGVATRTAAEGAVLASATGGATMTDAVAGATNTQAGVVQTYNPMTNTGRSGPTAAWPKSFPGTFYSHGVCTSSDNNNGSNNQRQAGQCITQEGFSTRRFKSSGTNTWTPPATRSVIRISTQELLGGAFGAGTPALGGGAGMSEMPNFSPNTNSEGIFLYDTNINLVLGSLYQPLMLSTDGGNFSFELARIPNVPAIYQRIYQRYAGDTGDAGVNYLGNTCNIYQCGTGGITGYQGSSATHSSISIGATDYNSTTNQLQAHKGVGAYGVSFGELKAGTGLSSFVQQDFDQVWRKTRSCNTDFWGDCNDTWGAWSADWSKVPTKAPITGQLHPSLNRANPYETTQRQNYNGQIFGVQNTMPQTDAAMAAQINSMAPSGASVANNFGSAAIDGLLIQHLKFTTTGLN